MAYIRLRRSGRQAGPSRDEAAIRREIAWAAGTESFSHRDPVYHVTEDFRNTFDEIGRRHAAETAGETLGGLSRQECGRQAEGTPDQQGRPPDGTDLRPWYEMKDPAQQGMVRKFSETAFQRGTMAGAVLQGTGRMMLISCLKRTAGQSGPVKEQQRRLFEGASKMAGIPGHSPDKVVFNRGFAKSAVGILVETLQDARSTVDAMADLAAGKSSMGSGGGAETLRRMYPFLDDSRERSLLERYRSRLEESMDPEERRLLQSALVQVRALMEKKAQMKAEFISRLRQISDRATEALTLFESPGFAEEAAREAEMDSPQEPPEPPGEDTEETRDGED